MGKAQRIELAKAASSYAYNRLARLKAAARACPPTAAKGRFPYPHRTCATNRRKPAAVSAADKYTFVIEPSPIEGHTRLSWQKNGRGNSLNFWHVPDNIYLAVAMERVRGGEFG